METFPSTLPGVNRDYNGSEDPGLLRTRMESGAFRQRPRFSQAQDQIAVRWDFTDAEFGLFRSFVQYNLNKGADWFEIPLFFGNGSEISVARLVGGKYSWSHKGVMNWTISAVLEIETPTYLPPVDAGGGITDFAGATLTDFAGSPITEF